MIQPVPLSAIRIVLVEPSHPGNIGAVARAMKNMALAELVLVRPKSFPHAEADARASGATDVLERARVADSVAEAVADCGFVAATTSRPRDHNFRALDLHEAAVRIFEMSARGPAAVLFGAERTGLTNEELALAHLLIRIPANPEYPSLNLAMAVQVACYEVAVAAHAYAPAKGRERLPATMDDLEGLFAHLERASLDTGFVDPVKPGRFLEHMRRLFARARLERPEVKLLRGLLGALEAKAAAAPSPVTPPAAAKPKARAKPAARKPATPSRKRTPPQSRKRSGARSSR